ncbi:MAG: nucleotidyltransferase domain-containing protein [Sulfuricurvum sp.]|nr:nucleotidyltransferase domain-containing protein [Sulfuricurvum sp.]MDD5386722.1 nucleotidyltransferase domain-containing protein [Sulfuricurvum sp.]
MSEKDIVQIGDTIIRIAQPQKLLLFGSGANGTMKSESDLDFLVVTDHFDNEDVQVRRELYRQNIRIPLDIIYVTPTSLSDKLKTNDSAFNDLYYNAKVMYG